MPDPIPFPQSRRTAPPAVPERPAGLATVSMPAAHPDNVVRLSDRRPATPFWCPVPPYVGGLLLGLTLAAAAAVCIGMDAVVGGWRIA